MRSAVLPSRAGFLDTNTDLKSPQYQRSRPRHGAHDATEQGMSKALCLTWNSGRESRRLTIENIAWHAVGLIGEGSGFDGRRMGLVGPDIESKQSEVRPLKQ
jgi:hypothetical protein